MHLADRRGGDRRRLELEEQPLERVAELLLDHALGLLERERAHVVLQPAQLDDDVGRHDVGPRREELPELHERRPELVEHLAQVLAARGRGGALLGRHVGEPILRGAPRQQVAQLVRLEEVAEAVAHHDLRDLRQASDAACVVLTCGKATRRVCRWPGARRASRLRVHGPGGTSSDSAWRYASPTAGRSVKPLDADVAAPPFREELAVERVEPLELEDVVGEQQPAAHEPAQRRRRPLRREEVGQRAEVERQLARTRAPSPTRASRRRGTPSGRSARPGGAASCSTTSRRRPGTARDGGSRRLGRPRPRRARARVPGTCEVVDRHREAALRLRRRATPPRRPRARPRSAGATSSAATTRNE